MTRAAASDGRARQAARRTIDAMVSVAGRTRAGQYILRQVIDQAMGQTRQVTYRGTTFRFAAPNALCVWRAETFAAKEPETLEWIDALPHGAVLWDVGANVGLYSVYAARTRGCRVYAFEPSVFNLELLARNIHLNGVGDAVCIVPLALTDALGTSELKMTTTDWGGALSSFGRDIGWDGGPVRQVFAFRTLGLSMDDAVARLGLPAPDYVKMDVDGLEHFILRGGSSVLASVQEILVEVNDDFRQQAEHVNELLTRAGLVLAGKRHSQLIANSSAGFAGSFNQIWRRP